MTICVDVYVQILPKGFKVCANGLIVVKITGKSGNETAKINVKKLIDLLLSVRVMIYIKQLKQQRSLCYVTRCCDFLYTGDANSVQKTQHLVT